MSIQLTVRGNLGQNCELKEIKRNDGETGFVLNFSVASTRYKRQNIDGQDRYVPDGLVEWIDCEIWGRQAQNLSKVLAKGMPVVIEGEERIEFYEKDGHPVRTRRLRADNVYLNLSSGRVESVSLKPPRTPSADAPDGEIPF